MVNSKILKFIDFVSDNFDIFTRAIEILKKCFVFFLVSFFKLIILTEIYKLCNEAVELYSLVYVVLSFFEVNDSIYMLCMSFMPIFIFTIISTFICVYFDKKVNNDIKTVTLYNGTFLVVSEKYNS